MCPFLFVDILSWDDVLTFRQRKSLRLVQYRPNSPKAFPNNFEYEPPPSAICSIAIANAITFTPFSKVSPPMDEKISKPSPTPTMLP